MQPRFTTCPKGNCNLFPFGPNIIYRSHEFSTMRKTKPKRPTTQLNTLSIFWPNVQLTNCVRNLEKRLNLCNVLSFLTLSEMFILNRNKTRIMCSCHWCFYGKARQLRLLRVHVTLKLRAKGMSGSIPTVPEDRHGRTLNMSWEDKSWHPSSRTLWRGRTKHKVTSRRQGDYKSITWYNRDTPALFRCQACLCVYTYTDHESRSYRAGLGGPGKDENELGRHYTMRDVYGGICVLRGYIIDPPDMINLINTVWQCVDRVAAWHWFLR